ncbi:MAG: protein-L-isoaspartate(D-aspartate) O-methyltransferase [Magnetovibrio sp.]|nr:protein-L-isoaspartate(D-aspartate) O-methyltransferase [Magnetovibrio sp.]
MSLDARMGALILELRRGGVTDARVLGAIETTPREVFLPDPFKARAYENVALPIGHHQTVSQPGVVGLMTQELDVTDRHKVLEIGTGSGYQAVILAKLCRRLYTVERHPELLAISEKRFAEMKLTNITAIAADGAGGWPEQAPFERILVAAAAADVPPVLFNQLAVGGIMILPIGLDEEDQRLTKVVRTEDGAETHDLGPTRFVPLVDGLAETGE